MVWAARTCCPQTTGATEWHVNADEPTVLDYNLEFKSSNHHVTLYAPDAYRSSDHDLSWWASGSTDRMTTRTKGLADLGGPGAKLAWSRLLETPFSVPALDDISRCRHSMQLVGRFGARCYPRAGSTGPRSARARSRRASMTGAIDPAPSHPLHSRHMTARLSSAPSISSGTPRAWPSFRDNR